MMPGARFGPYEVLAAIGAGGMGEVFRARDTTLNREVAIKVLPAALAVDAERLARFKREAQVLASLNHPNIAHVYGFEGATLPDGSAVHFLAMELVEGEDLSERLKRGAIPVDEAIAIARQIAEGLEEAHERGIIHRDLKPANIKVTPDGKVKVLDFGLAKALEGDPASSAANSQLSHSPTMSRHMTEAGVIMGTAAYMSPEQARGKPVDKRTDIWAFGVVLVEMLTGRRLFAGETVSDVLAAVLQADIDLRGLPASTPVVIRRLITRCLDRDPKKRLRDIGEARLDLEGAGLKDASGSDASPAGEGNPRSRRPLTTALAAMAVPALFVVLWGWLRAPSAGTNAVLRYEMALPEGEAIGGWFARLALSPDGTRIAYINEGDGGIRRLLVRSRDQWRGAVLNGTDGAECPFFSPDGESIGFFSPRGTLNTVPTRGGDVTPLSRTRVGYAGASWGPDGFIYADGEGNQGLVRVRASGGVPEPFTTVDKARGEKDHVFPEVLPDGKHVVFTVTYAHAETDPEDIAIADVETGHHRVLLRGTFARYAASGHLLYGAWPDRSIMSQPFDAAEGVLRGAPRMVDKRLWYGAVGAPFWVPDFALSRTGTFMTSAADERSPRTDVVWVGRNGEVQPVDPGWADQLGGGGGGRVALSPDGHRLAVTLGGEIWIKELDRGPITKLTFKGGFRPAWSPDGRSVAFISDRNGRREAFVRKADGTGSAELLATHDWQVHEIVYSGDGQWVIYRIGGGGQGDLYARKVVSSEGEPVPLVVSDAQESQPVLSPDGRWLAYMSLESGRPEVWVRPFSPTADGRWKVSPNGGSGPLFAHTGRELFYRDGNDNLVSVEITPGPTFTYAPPRVLFSARRYLKGIYTSEYAVAPDDRRFIFVRRLTDPEPDRLVVTENLFALLRGTAER